MRTLHEILQDQREAQILESEFDAMELREIVSGNKLSGVLTNPATMMDMGTLEGWEF